MPSCVYVFFFLLITIVFHTFLHTNDPDHEGNRASNVGNNLKTRNECIGSENLAPICISHTKPPSIIFRHRRMSLITADRLARDRAVRRRFEFTFTLHHTPPTANDDRK